MAGPGFGVRARRACVFGAVSIGAVVIAAAPAAAADAAKTPTFTKDVAPIFQAKCEACHRADSMAPMALVTYQDARPWARSIKARVTARQMPPWHIDKNVGIQEFKNDRSLSDSEIDVISRWVDAGAPQGDPKDMPPAIKWPDASVWNFAKLFGGPPDLIVKSPSFTMPAHAQDAWDKRATPSGVTEPRWVRAIEIRPATIKGRKIVHHALARLSQDDPVDNAAAANSDDDSGVSAGPGLFMEWAVGKQGEIMRPDTGKLLLPGSQFVWDIHYSAAGEEITNNVELGIYFYPKGQEPKFRQVLHLMGTGGIDIPPNAIKGTQGFFVMKQSGRVESFQPHMHLRGKAMMMEAILPSGPDADAEPRRQLQLQLAQQLLLRGRSGAAPAEGHGPPHHGVARQHGGQQVEPRSEPVGRLRRPHGGRDGARVGERHLHARRGFQGRSREAQGSRREDDGRLQRQQ